MIAIGDTFFFDPDGAGNDHLWVVIGDTMKDCAREFVIVNITSWTNRAEEKLGAAMRRMLIKY